MGADMSNRSDDWREDLIKCVVMLPAMVSFGVGAIVLAYQAIHWLNHAVWPTVTVRDGLAWWNGGYFLEVSTGALGFDEIVRWCLDSSLPSCMMLILPVAWIFSGIFLFESLMGKRVLS